MLLPVITSDTGLLFCPWYDKQLPMPNESAAPLRPSLLNFNLGPFEQMFKDQGDWIAEERIRLWKQFANALDKVTNIAIRPDNRHMWTGEMCEVAERIREASHVLGVETPLNDLRFLNSHVALSYYEAIEETKVDQDTKLWWQYHREDARGTVSERTKNALRLTGVQFAGESGGSAIAAKPVDS